MSKFFADTASVILKSGRGGKGSVSFRSEKFAPKGGPDGGNGGDGGNVVFLATRDERTLRNLKFNKVFEAEDGHAGMGENKHGKNGQDLLIKVPVGTIIKDEYEVLIAHLYEENQKIVLMHGGRGGKGNSFFKSSTHQTPRFAQAGEPSTELQVHVELELIADFGFVGAPNVGKSTLLKTVTKSNPKIANYPFTTLTPNLGVLKNHKKELMLADFPGIIEGASTGYGLGLEFLKHIRKTKGLVFVVDSCGEDIDKLFEQQSDEINGDEMSREWLRFVHESLGVHILTQYNMLVSEIREYEVKLLDKPIFLLISKIDMSLLSEDDRKIDEFMHYLRSTVAMPFIQEIICVSSFTGKGMEDLKELLLDFELESDGDYVAERVGEISK